MTLDPGGIIKSFVNRINIQCSFYKAEFQIIILPLHVNVMLSHGTNGTEIIGKLFKVLIRMEQCKIDRNSNLPLPQTFIR
jgi:hypothetical protein